MSDTRRKVLIVGGGFSGLAAAIDLCAAGGFAVTLINREPHFLDVTQLQRSVASDVETLRISLPALALRHGFRFVHAAVNFSGRTLAGWHRERWVKAADEVLPFDFLVLATGAAPATIKAGRLQLERPRNVVDLARLRTAGALPHIARLLAEASARDRALTIVGAGPTGLQFLFELDDHLRARREDCLIHLVNAGIRLLPALPPAFHRYVAEKIAARGGTIWPHLGSRFVSQGPADVAIGEEKSGEVHRYGSRLTLLLGGVTPQPMSLATNRYGQVMLGDKLLPAIFAAGDCARFAGGGLDAMTAQAAVRKGKAVGENIRRLSAGEHPAAYDYQELGYFLSLGPLDGIGWMASRRNILTGASAFTVKAAIEAQFKLFLRGVDSYVL